MTVKREPKKAKSKPKQDMSSPAPQLIWQRMAASGKSRKLDYPSIARAATHLADEGGLDELSMRNLATRLGVGTMSLYRYVTDKNDLLDLIIDEAYGEIPLPETVTKNWRSDVINVAIATRRMMLNHPWLPPLLTQRPTLGPNYLRWFEFLLAATAAPRRTIQQQLRMVGTIWAFLSGFVGYELGEIEAYQHHRLTEDQKREIVGPYMEEILSTGRFPYLSKFVKNVVPASSDEDFQFGLDVVLNGLARSQQE
jgi:AcrR family transcriptional regulator